MTPGIALVTGAGARLGRAMALALGEDGWQVAVHYRTSKEGAEETCAMIRDAGGAAEPVSADLADEMARGDLVARAACALGGPVSLLINSASTFEDDALATHSRANWDFHMEPNLRAPIHLAQQMAGDLPDGTKGLVLNLIDQRVWKLNPTFFTYTLSKAALWQATQTMAQALAPQIRVNAIGPGPVLASVHQTADVFAAEKAATLTGEGSSPEEIVRAMRYLIAASSVTGQMIACDGGQHLMWQTPDTLT
ncbi:MAG TPA: SDR family oxidoreductase [Hyphomonas sp.]|nr:SDR family oxidoreductase [Hyphomonas sp.]HRX73129.1 SDR family oxidoreductase [Hyphomonas sp.]